MKKIRSKATQPIKKFTEEMHIGESSAANEYKIEFRGMADVVLEGCLGVIEYSTDCITLNLGRQTVSFRGADLEIQSFFDGFLTITGTVMSADFSSGG